MSLKPKSAALWFAVPLMAMNLIACGDDEEVPQQVPPRSELCGNGEDDPGEECDDGNLNPQDGCLPNCTEAACGDGIVQLTPAGAEECDDGNRVNGDTCSNTCKGPVCGNGVKESGEACDDPDDDNCTDECALASCGNGTEEPGEECDDGNANDADGCTSKCLESACGDGIVQMGEECDLGSANSDSGICLKSCQNAECGDGKVLLGIEACDSTDEDACTDECALPTCGDGEIQGDEVCDDGNRSETDACSNACLPTLCGDGVRQAGEECDDGNGNNNDACLNTCKVPTCGDGFIQQNVEQCDDAEDNGPFPARCSDECTLTRCGNGEVDPGEDCDLGDGNGPNSACLASCVFNVCGDGFALTDEESIDETGTDSELEECDDANPDNADPCVDTCKWNTCGDGFQYTKPYTDVEGNDGAYPGDADGNEDANNPFPLEPCDDGNTSNTDSCVRTETTFGDGEDEVSAYTCSFNHCGDGQVYTTVTDDDNPFPTEDCDDADALDDPTRNNDSCLDSCVWASCHDGFLYTNKTIASNPNNAIDEECDDGNESDTDNCVGDCEVATCGDGFLHHGVESCDDGGAAGGCASPGTCVLDTCGNGTLETGEQCDDGNDNDNDSCLSTCQWNSCGDGIRYMATTDTRNTRPLEQCDDANGLDRDSCLASCEWNSCGDGKPRTEDPEVDCREGYTGDVCDIDVDRVEGDDDCDEVGGDEDANQMDNCASPYPYLEDCDDGIGSPDTDSCKSDCTFAGCGDGVVYTTLSSPMLDPVLFPLEQCDDGEATAECTAMCTNVSCGDAIVSLEAGESCDPGLEPWKSDGGCNNCVVSTCGNGEDDEDYPGACDDGNRDNEDDCTNNCFQARCGDGIVQPGRTLAMGEKEEQCDDGNSDPTDGCTNDCQEARCGDGIRQVGVEACDAGEFDSESLGAEDDDYLDTTGFCNNECELVCFPSPVRPWTGVYDDSTCVFVPESFLPEQDEPGVYNDVAPVPYSYPTFFEAEEYCAGLGIGAHLVKIDSENKNAFVLNLLDSIAATPDSDLYIRQDAVECDDDEDDIVDGGDPDLCGQLVEDQPYWIGLRDLHTTQPDPRGYWTWIGDGSLVSNTLQSALWEPTEPNDADNDPATAGQEDCGVMIQSDDDGVGAATPGRWNDRGCAQEYRFVCEFPLGQNP